ncbi:MAG TPA: response regulator [Rectinemataceae bacterium]|nr:response regulator [Rectinemataceae bacterium]
MGDKRRALVLVAEDDTALQAALVSMLEADGHEAAGVPDGADLLQRIRTGRRPDLVVLDLDMPVMNGWEFLVIRESDPVLLLIPVIVVSGERRLPPEISRSAHIAKPVRLEEFRRLVEAILDQGNPDPARAPHRTEPWSVDPARPNVVRNSFGHVAAIVATAAEARRVVAAVNGTSRLSTDALERGIIDEGLDCLYDLDRYDTDEDYRRRLGGREGRTSILVRRREIASQLDRIAFSPRSGPRSHGRLPGEPVPPAGNRR